MGTAGDDNASSRPTSVASRNRTHVNDLHDDEPVSVHHPDSPTYSLHSAHPAPTSHSGSSSHHGEGYVKISLRDREPVHLHFPDEDHDGERVDRHDQLSRVHSSDRGGTRHSSRSQPIRRIHSEQDQPRDIPRSRPPDHPRSPTESGDSAEDFIHARPGPRPMARPQSYYDYQHSGSSGSGYAQQLVHAQPPPHHYGQYPPMQGPPPPVPYPSAYPHYAPPHPASHVSSPYAPSPYGPQSMVPSQYGAPSYFPPQQQLLYGQPYPPQQYPPQYMQYPPHMPPMQMPPYVDQYRVQSPSHNIPPASASESAKDSPAHQELLKRFDALMKEKAEDKQKDDSGMITKEEALRQAMEQVRAEKSKAAADAAARSEEESRIREQARLEAKRDLEAENQRIADQVAREEKIRKEAAEAALKAAEAAAAAKAERAEAEKKIAADAAEKAKTAAEKEAAAKAAEREAEAKKAQEEAETKLKEAEEAAAKAKADAEAAEKKAAENAPPEKRAPVRFRDAIGRNYNFPFERCYKWRDMEGLINQAFAHVDHLADWVHTGNYDLLGPDQEIIMPQYWRETIQPDMQITMMLWPMPEKDDKENDPVVAPLDGDGILSLDDILNPGGDHGGGKKKKDKDKDKDKKKKGSGRPSGLAAWMIGGSSGKRTLKR